MTETVIIRKQKFRIRTSNQELALQLRHELNDHLQVGLLAVYEEVFESIPDLKNRTVYIDKLLLDLGTCTADEFVDRLPILLKQAILKRLREQQEEVNEMETRAGRPAGVKPGGISSTATDEVTALFHFFEKGFFPWWRMGIGARKDPTAMIAALDEQAIENLLVRIISAPRHAGDLKAERIRQRFLQALSTAGYPGVIHALIMLQSDQQVITNSQLLAAEETMQYCCSFFLISNTQYRQELIHFLLLPSLTQERDLMQSFIRRLAEKKKAGQQASTQFNKEKTQEGETSSPVHAAIRKAMEEISNEKKSYGEQPTQGNSGNAKETTAIKEVKEGKEETTKSIPGKKEVKEEKEKKEEKEETAKNITGKKEEEDKKQDGLKNSSQQESQQESPKQTAKKKTATSPQDELPEEGAYIDNGGLVILHPFFQPLFTELELMTVDGAFVAEEAKHRATVILNYLLTGDSSYSECDMVLNKLICGIPVDDVLPADITLTEKETSECDGLLETVVGYWEALKGASKEAMRETFFQRKAKIRFKDDHWLLQVERNATDILLDRLPWGIGIVRLPWLQYLIHVEW